MIGYSLARRHRDGFQVHRLLQTVIRDRTSPPQRDHRGATALALLAAAYPGDPDEPAHWAGYGRLAAHILATGPLGDDRRGNRRLLLDTTAYLVNTGDQAAGSLAEELHERWQRVLGPDHPDTLAAAATLTTALVSWSECDQAAAVGEDALRRARRVLGPDHPVTQRMAINYAFALTFVGRYAELAALEPGVGDRAERESPDTEPARAVAEFTLQRALRDLGPDHPMVLAMSSLKAVAAVASLARLGDTEQPPLRVRDALRAPSPGWAPTTPPPCGYGNLVLNFVWRATLTGVQSRKWPPPAPARHDRRAMLPGPGPMRVVVALRLLVALERPVAEALALLGFAA